MCFRLQTRQWSDRVIRKETREWKVRNVTMRKDVQVVVTPRVREEVQRHYGCQALSGAELEDQGEEGTALTHWEKRLFEVGLEVVNILVHSLCKRGCTRKKILVALKS